MTTILPKPTDTKLTEDWRTGLVVLPTDHVYGATALTTEEWAERDRRPHGDYVVFEETAHRHVFVSEHGSYRTHAEVFVEVGHVMEMAPGAFLPQRGPLRLIVKEVGR